MHGSPLHASALLALAGCANDLEALPPPPAPALVPPRLQLAPPVAGAPDETWFVVKHVDLDPGPGVRTVTGQAFAEDGHSGTDFAIRSLRHLVEGVPVLAPADGEVVLVRDGEWDRCSVDSLPPAGRECGNTVAIRHSDGWLSQLCHLRKGSVTARKGDRVLARQPVGLVGWSGLAGFPHVHYRLSRHDVVVDPWLGPDPEHPVPLWRDPASVPMAHPRLVDVGFTDGEIGYDEASRRPGGLAVVSARAPAMAAYVLGYTSTGDTEWRMSVTDPTGRRYEGVQRDKGLAWGIGYLGPRRKADELLAVGTWTAHVDLVV